MNLFLNWSIGQKIAGIVTLLISLLIISSSYGIIKINGIGDEMRAVQSEDIPLVELVTSITVKQLEKAVLIEKSLYHASIKVGDKSIATIHHAITELADEIDHEIKQGRIILTNAGTKQHSKQQTEELAGLEKSLLAVEQEHTAYEQKVEHLMKALETHAEVPDQEIATLEKVQNNIDHHLVKILADVEAMTQNALATALDDEESALQGMILLVIISVILGVYLGIQITRTIIHPLNHAVHVAQQLSKGDLTVKLNILSTDESGQLLAAMQTMIDKWHDMIIQISSVTGRLTHTAREIAVVATQTAHNLEVQRENLLTTSTSMTEMMAAVQSVAEHSSKTSESTGRANDEVERGHAVVHEVNNAINGLASELGGTKATISRLADETDGVDSILNVIVSIAEQTNLLALNAAIEAARAGEQGRGFAVVADEVRTLASRTQQSIIEIQQMTQGLKAEAQNSVQAMEEGQAVADKTVDLANQAEELLSGVAHIVTEVNGMNLQIASAAERQTAVSQQINVSVDSISVSADENSTGAQHIAAATDEIAALTDNLESLVNEFKVTDVVEPARNEGLAS